MHQAHRMAPAQAAREQDGVLPPRPGPAPWRAVVVPSQPGAVTESGPRLAPALPQAAEAPWRMVILAVEPVPQSVKAARDFTTRTLLRWGMRGLTLEATVVVSELVTNAVRHGAHLGQDGAGGAWPELVLWGRNGQLVCVVIDSSVSSPARAPAGLAAEDGRGLHVVEALAPRWGWAVLGVHRKAVWAVLSAPDPGSDRGAPAPAALPG